MYNILSFFLVNKPFKKYNIQFVNKSLKHIHYSHANYRVKRKRKLRVNVKLYTNINLHFGMNRKTSKYKFMHTL